MRTLRDIPASLSPLAVSRIDARLAAIRQEHGVAIPLAIESGSRAWGFPAPDSDYDCRFIFVRPAEDYLSPWQRRDVIEASLEGDLDVNGWDLGKAIRLLAKGNAVIVEWLMSPIMYGGDQQFREGFLALAERMADRHLVARHYLHLGERFWQACCSAGEPAPQKKVFYALRPAVALRWLRLHSSAVSPMHLPTLLAECDPPVGLADIVTDLITRKAEAAELSAAALPAIVADFGDMDVIVPDSAGLPALRQEIAVRLGITLSKTAGRLFSTIYDGLQTDFFAVEERFVESMYNYMSFNDLGNLLGRVCRRFNLKYGEDGLTYTFRRADGGHYKADLPVTQDFARICAF